MKNILARLIQRRKPQLRHYVTLGAFTLCGVAILQFIFAFSYLGAFHSPSARDLPVAIVGDNAVQPLADALEKNSNNAYKSVIVSDIRDAESQLKTQRVYAIYQPAAPRGIITIASANGKSLAQPLTTSLAQLDRSYQQQSRQIATQQGNQAVAAAPIEGPVVTDIAPLPDTDKNGVSLFYAAFSAVFGGYLAAVAVNLVRGKRSFSRSLAVIRIAGFGAFSIVTSLGTALIITQGVQAISAEHFWTLTGIMGATTFGVSLVSSALISLFGTLGTALVIILFVIFGTPASGGPLPLPLTGDGPWRALAPILPTGASFDSLRQAIYFGGTDVWNHLKIIAVYVVLGAGVLIIYGARRSSVSTFEDDIAAENTK